MPFDVHDFPGATRLDRAATRRSRRLVCAWLLTVAGMIAVMIVLGGATRLTGSGLSIMEWAPIMGTLPPVSDAEWQRLFDLYKEIPQYTLINQGLGLDGFKQIFWLEWTHRLWGRLIGAVFLLPLVWFALTGRIERKLVPRLGVLFLLGGLQGGVGWFMVASGFLPDSTAVSPYRLVIHLSLALALYAAIIWTALSALLPARHTPAALAPLRRLAIAGCAMVAVTIVAGGFVAGLHAGLTYNTFPLMAGRLLPPDYAALHPFIRNLTENVAAVQFDHRLLATGTLLLLTAISIMTWRSDVPRAYAACVFGAVIAQYALGVTTLLLVVPLPIATLHQFGAVMLLTAVLILLHRTYRAPVNAAPNTPVLDDPAAAV